VGSGLIIQPIRAFSKKLRLSPFAFSFIFLGILTSIPEISVGLQAVADHDAEIFVGNLLGGIPVLFLFVIPLLAIFGNGVSLKHEMDKRTLLLTLGVILTPSIVILDKRVTNPEGALLIMLYLLLVYVVERKKGILDTENKLFDSRAYSPKDILKILLGIGIVFLASSTIVDKTLYFADILGVSAFYISLIVVSLGTNLPELSLAIRSVISGGKDVAIGDYMGSAAANTVLFGIFTLMHNGEVITGSNFVLTFAFIALALSLTYFFFQKRQYITRGNGFVLLGIYVLFVIVEYLR
jgi:cation:H+ antiporter